MAGRGPDRERQSMDLRTAVDAALELTIVGSFTKVGYAVRRRMYDWADPAPGALDGRTVLITGPTSGLGRAAADTLAALGARMILVGRSEDKLIALRDALAAAHGTDRFPIVVADMRSLTSVRAAVARILDTEPALDVLIDNAGAIYPERTVGPDGIESTLATLVVGPFALEAGLLPLLRASADARVIAVTSGGQYAQSLDLDDLGSANGAFSGARAYARAKRAQVALIREWHRRLPAAGVRFQAMHPGWADTPGLSASLPGFSGLMGPLLRTPAEGIDTLIWLAAAPRDEIGPGGELFLDRRPRPFDRAPGTRLSTADRRRLWDLIVGLSGAVDPAPEG